MLVSGAVGSVIGSLCSGFLPQGLYNKLTGIILLLLALQMLISFLRKKRGKTAEQDPAQTKMANTIKAVCFGLLGGIMSGTGGLKRRRADCRGADDPGLSGTGDRGGPRFWCCSGSR
jgi:uncharacterized membrane protein YfcA